MEEEEEKWNYEMAMKTERKQGMRKQYQHLSSH